MLLAGLCIGLAVLVGPAAFADFDVQKTYTIAATPGVGVTGSVADISLGGAQFAAGDADYATPLSVSVADATGTAPAITVCQDTIADAGGFCGDTGEPRVDACGTADLADSTVPFDPAVDIAVFVTMADAACIGGVGTTGTITLTYAGNPSL